MIGIKKMNETVIFKTLSGSKLYGTHNENSDTDIKGVFLPSMHDLILGKAPKHYVSSTGKSNEKNNAEDIDETYYSLQYYLELLSKGDTTALDMLFAYTNEKVILTITPVWQELISNIDKVLTKNMKAYLGYCRNQSLKYSVKCSKLNNFKKFKDFCERHQFDINKNGERISVKQVLMDLSGNKFENYIPEPLSERIKFNLIDFGEHCYILTAWNGESYISISDVKIDLNDKITDAKHKIEKSIASYGKRAENAASDNGADYKALSHAVRVILQVEEILKTNHLNFPLKDVDFIKSIKYKTTDMTFDDIIDWINNKIKEIDEVLLPNSNLPEKADHKWIENFILKVYSYNE